MIVKKMVTACVLAALMIGFGFADEFKNYRLVVDGQSYEVNLDDELKIVTPKGETLTIVLKKKPYSQFSDAFVSFQHKSGMSVSSKKLGVGISQLMANTATGTLIMIQEYTGMDPSMLVPMLLKELTKESVEYGRKMIREKITRKLESGITLTGLKATLTYLEDESYYEVLAYGKKDKGVLVITQIDKAYIKSEKEIHDHFWKTLKIKI